MTQAISLANFANNLDSSGGLNPNALNAATPISKGGTGGTTAAAAVSNLLSEMEVQLFPVIYPVGSVYMNASVSTNPATLFGFGTWVSLGAGRVLMGDGGGYSAGSTGGSADAIVVSHTHTATVTDPGHKHQFYINSNGSGAGESTTAGYRGLSSAGVNLSPDTSSVATGISVANSTTGSSGTGANLPPYLVVYMWQRTA